MGLETAFRLWGVVTFGLLTLMFVYLTWATFREAEGCLDLTLGLMCSVFTAGLVSAVLFFAFA